MKKLLSLLMVLCCAIVASAQQGWTARTGNSQDRTVVIADFSVTNGDPVYQGNWQIGAFVNDECRLVTQDNATGVLTTQNNQQFLTLEIPGNFETENDKDKAIVIKVRSSMGDVYTLTPDQTLTWQSQYTYGVGSGPRVQLPLTLPTSVTLSGFRIDEGNSVDLKDFLNVSPANSQIPDNLLWYVGDSYNQPGNYGQFATISGSTLTAVKPNLSNGENLPIPYGFVINGGNNSPLLVNGNPVQNATFYIERPVKTLTIVTEAFEVQVNQTDVLTAFMLNNNTTKAYSTAPAETTDKVKWEIEDASYIQEGQGTWTPIKGGTTRIRPYVERTEGNLYPEGNKWITVTIIVPVSGAQLNWPIDGQTQEYVTFKVNVGDQNIYQRLASFVIITPEEATNKTFTMENVSQSQGIISVDESNKNISALQAGIGRVKIQPSGTGGENHPVYINIEVFDPLKEVSFTQNPLLFSSGANTTLDVVNAGIRQNIVWQQTGKTLQDGAITIEGVLTGSGTIGPNGPMLTLTNTELPKGESTVTVTLGWNDYSNYVGTDGSIAKTWNNGQSFTVKITKELDHFVITVTPDNNYPTTGTITLTPVPADADFNWADYANILSVTSQNYDNSWHTFDMKYADEGSYSYMAILPGLFSATCGQNETVEFEVPARVTFESGWQWKSNPYGKMRSNKNLYNYFGDDLAEARTYDKLLFNDPEWGYWGSLYESSETAIAQAQMYKVKMSAEHLTWLSEGQKATKNAYAVAQGWNWIGSPYFYQRTLVNAVSEPVEGMVIVGKTGSAEYSGNAWSGDLKTIDPQQGYYVYLPATPQTGEFELNSEVNGMAQGDDTPAGARMMSQSVWSYDHSRFANNMTMVAEVSNLEHPEQYTIGAFVGDECRGEGIFEHGLAFITVHTDGGEQVSFQLHNELTNEYIGIDQTVNSGSMRLGSLKAPVQLTGQLVVTGISNIERTPQHAERYDLNGRTVNADRKGMTIERMANGTFRKVVR